MARGSTELVTKRERRYIYLPKYKVTYLCAAARIKIDDVLARGLMKEGRPDDRGLLVLVLKAAAVDVPRIKNGYDDACPIAAFMWGREMVSGMEYIL